MTRLTAYWKQFVELVTDLTRRLRLDLFFRTEVTIIVLQVAFALLILLVVQVTLSSLYANVTSQIISGIQTSISATTSAQASGTIVTDLEATKRASIISIGIVILLVTLLFGYLIARLALAPTRNALSAQKQFIGNIAHELRTPLSIIKTNMEVRLMDVELSPEGRRVLKSNLEELDRISDTINNLLSINTLIRPERVEFSNVDLGVIVTRVVDFLNKLAEHKNIDVVLRLGSYRCVWGNATALEQITTNVIKNALNYTPKGGRVKIKVDRNHRGDIEFVVEDTGVGIKKADLYRIFEPFYRSDSSRNRAQGGSGLGLTIVNELVKLHHGKIVVQSAPKRGTVVNISLPCPPKKSAATLSGKDQPEEIAMDFS